MGENITSFDVVVLPVTDDEALASIVGSDDTSLWVTFVFTDDIANANAQGIHQDEFERVIRTGLHKPFKKKLGYTVASDHDDAVPVGAIADLKKEENKIVGVASVWEREFPDDAAYIRDAYAAKEPLGVSWEVFYEDTEVDEEGTEWLKKVSTRAITLVGQPAYAGRTPLLAVAAKQRNSSDDKILGVDKQMADNELKEQLDLAKQEAATLKTTLEEANANLTQLGELQSEVKALREFKAKVEEEKATLVLVEARLSQFAEAGIEMTKEDFLKEAKRWLALDEETFKFVLETMVNSPDKESTASAQVDSDEEVDTDSPAAVFEKFLAERKEKSK